MNLLKRAQPVQQLAELDMYLNSQSQLEAHSWHDDLQSPVSSDTSSQDESTMTSDLLEDGEPATKTQPTSYKETSLDESDYTDYSDPDFAPDSEAGSSSEPDEDTPLYPVAKKPLPSLRYPLLPLEKQDTEAESPRAIDFIHCFHCQGLYAKKILWKHMKICPAKTETGDESSMGKTRVRSKCALKTAVVRDVSEGLKSVISCMNFDEVTQIIQNDQLLLQFGQHLFDLNRSRKNRHDYIRQRLRELGRLLLAAQKNTPIRKAEELINPANFNHAISAVRELAGYSPENNTFRTPSLSLKIGNSLGTISELIESDNLSTDNRDWSLVQFAREFKTIKKFRWKGLITRGATTTLRESKWNAPQIIPFTEDVKRLDFHMENVKLMAERILRLCPSANNYATLAKVTLAQLIIFNRRREGEVSRMELATFEARKKSELNEDMAVCLTPLENKMCDFFTRVEIRGKRGRGVPVLLKPSMVSAMELLAGTREVCGVSKENIYMFGRPGALSVYRGGECIKKFARESGAKHPEVLTSTRLRKHIARMSQVLNLQENEADQFGDFLGRDIRVHRQYYRLPQGTLQLAKMSKVLLAVEKGTLSQYKGQTLDDIEIDPEEKVDSSQDQDVSSDEDEPDESTIEATGEDDHETTGEDDHEATGEDDHEATGEDDHEATGEGSHEATGEGSHEATGEGSHEATGEGSHASSDHFFQSSSQ